MPSAKELRDELRMLRKEKAKPVSKMRKGDVAAEIEKLKAAREETPAPAAVPSASQKKSVAAVESIKEAKRMEFPVKPSSGLSKSSGKKASAASAPAAEKKKSKLDRLMEMMDTMSDTDDE